MCRGLRVNSIREESRTDTVTRNITNEQAELVLVGRVQKSEVPSDRVHGMIEDIDAQGVRDHGSRCKAFLDPCCESQVFFDFRLTLLELLVGRPEFFLGANKF